MNVVNWKTRFRQIHLTPKLRELIASEKKKNDTQSQYLH